VLFRIDYWAGKATGSQALAPPGFHEEEFRPKNFNFDALVWRRGC